MNNLSQRRRNNRRYDFQPSWPDIFLTMIVVAVTTFVLCTM